jgi:hypothetical protein
MWGNPESFSGFGSTLAATADARRGLEELIGRYHVSSILDVPCGDFNWMQALRYAGDYTGADIVPDLVARNSARYGRADRRFLELDVCKDALPPADLVLCRECLNHLPVAAVDQALVRLEAAAKRLVVLTHYPEVVENVDQPASFVYRSLNFSRPPFSLRPPDELIDEGTFEAGKHLGIWDLQRGPLNPRRPAPAMVSLD